MSHVVEPSDLSSVATEYAATAYLLYAKAGSARVNHVRVEGIGSDGTLTCRGFGRGLQSPVDDGATLSVLWPAAQAGQFSLIADGVGHINGDVLTISIASAVLHRPAPSGDGPASC